MWIPLNKLLHCDSRLHAWVSRCWVFKKKSRQESNSLLTALHSAVCLTSAELSSSLSLRLLQRQSIYQRSFITVCLFYLLPCFTLSLSIFNVTDIFDIVLLSNNSQTLSTDIYLFKCSFVKPPFSITHWQMHPSVMFVWNNVIITFPHDVISWIFTLS